MGEPFTARVKCAELLPTEFDALTVKASAVATVVGGPEMRPVDAFKLSPAGSVPAVTAQVMGVVPEAERVCE